MWRGQVLNSIRGKRGQALIKDLRDALDEMPVKRLITNDLIRDGEVCALGSVGIKRRVENLEKLDPEDYDNLANVFNVAKPLIREIEYENDEGRYNETPEERWRRMRNWCEKMLKKE
jgi:hypothetical protein